MQLFATLQLLLTVILSCISVRSLSGFLSVVPTSLQWQFIPAHHIIETIKSLIDFKCPDLLCVDGEVFRVALSSPHTTGTGHHHQLVLLNWNLLRGLGERRSRLDIVRYIIWSFFTDALTVVLIHYELKILNTQIDIDICYLSTNIYYGIS